MDIPRPQNKFRRRLIRGLAAGAVLGGLAVITLGVSRLKPADPTVEKTAVVIDTVKRGPMLREVRGYGKLVPEETHWIPATTQGRVERILVHPGAAVQPETVLLEMSNAELAQDVASAEMDVKAAEADYTSLRVRLEKENLDQKAAFAMMQAAYSQATLEAQLYEQLAQEGLKSELELKTAQNRAQELTIRFEIEKQRLAISSEAVEAQLAAQRARADQYRAKAKLKQSQLEALRVRAGTSGVLALLPVEVGQQVTPGTNLARVANPQHLKAEVKIPETQAKDMQIGLKATVDTHNGLIYGHVARIDPAVQEGSVTLDVGLDGALPQGARQDLSVDGTIELERLSNVLFVGRPAFGQEKSMAGLFRLEDQGRRASRVQVQFGRASVNAVEILEGLNEGDQVIISDMSAWDSFDHIRLN
ncbi:MAG: HlyD family efflux transporter periplasmic adaptor subunit [Acidobacteria bacterium]|nr:HlyD family efflux transporter periplasmic adaptor subunit [Acidobacteriota bacterium]